MDWVQVVTRFGGQLSSDGKYMARCPCHDDNKPSLEITIGKNGKTLVLCRVCGSEKTEKILAAVGLKFSDLVPPEIANGHASNGNHKANGKSKREIEATYDYCDEGGKLIFQKVRFKNPKDFSLRQPNSNGGWIWNMGGARRILYRLPDFLRTDPEQFVYVVEGEKDVERAKQMGFAATCNSEGASKDGSKPKWLPDSYNEHLRGRNVVIIPDNDDAGRAHAHYIASSLIGVAASVRVLTLPGVPPKGDLSDWANAGGTTEQLIELTESCPLWKPSDAPADSAAADDKPGPPLSVTQLTDQYKTLREPTIHGLARRGETVNCIAAPKFGKSWAIYELAICGATGKRLWDTFLVVPGNVLIIDNELFPETLSNRLPLVAKALNIDPTEYADRLFVATLRGKLCDIDAIGRYLEQFEAGTFSIIIIDAFYRVLPVGTDENSNSEITAIYNKIDAFAARLNATFVLVHHASKGNQSLKNLTDVGAGAGAQSRAADTHLILRPHTDDGVAVLEAAVRSWPPVDPLCLRWDFPIWRRDDRHNPADLRSDKPKQNIQRAADRMYRVLLDKGPLTKTAWREAAKMSGRSATDPIERLLEEGRVVTCKLKAGKYDGFQAVIGSPQTDPDTPGQTPDSPPVRSTDLDPDGHPSMGVRSVHDAADRREEAQLELSGLGGEF